MVTYWLEGKKFGIIQKKGLSPSATSEAINQSGFGIIPGVV